ncbi:class D sortase [Planococcus salinarum]|nr:class D sortase [Planococcus salinarum]
MVVAWSGYSLWQQTQAVTHTTDEVPEQFGNWEHTTYQQQLAVPAKKKMAEQTPETPDYTTGDKVGTLNIPRIGTQYEVYWGTGEDTLKQGVGMYDSQWTVTPDHPGHVVLSGHRETVFSQLGSLKEGDHLYASYDGNIYDYQIRDMWITDAEDRTVIVDKNKPTLTLTTCYPFDFVGSAPDRYIVQAELVSVETIE